MVRLCTQCPISAEGSGRKFELSPWVAIFQLSPPSSLRKAPAEEIAQ